MKFNNTAAGLTLAAAMMFTAAAHAEHGGSITASLHSVDVMHNGQPVQISRTIDDDAVIPSEFAKVGRKCPPFCLHHSRLREYPVEPDQPRGRR